MKNFRLRRNIFILGASFILVSNYAETHKYTPTYKILESDEEAFASYENGLIYIGEKDFINEVKEDIKEGDVLVIDKRNRKNPNMQVVESYKITDQNQIKDILNCLVLYENEFPSRWSRTMDSMIVEWEVHNFLYQLNYKRNHTDDVDLDNQDENIYHNICLKRLFLSN